MPRICLTKDEIKELASLLSEVFEHLTTLRSDNHLAKKIQFPKIPAVLSESIVIHLLRENRIVPNINAQEISFGGREADIIARTSSGDILKIEVKATGSSAFEYFGEKDVTSDFLVWIHFGDFFVSTNQRLIDIFIIRNPSHYFNKPMKITLRRFMESIGTNVQQLRLNLDEL
jgi:hypothetical protein